MDSSDVELDFAELFGIAVMDVELVFDFLELILLALFALCVLDFVLSALFIDRRGRCNNCAYD